MSIVTANSRKEAKEMIAGFKVAGLKVKKKKLPSGAYEISYKK